MQTFRIGNFSIDAVATSASRICYILSPFEGLGNWAQEAARRFDVSVAVITGMDWDNDLTPWQAKGVPAGCPDFKGNASRFLSLLDSRVVPEAERRLGLTGEVERTLTGVSLSGLFTLWQWMECDTFRNIISLSGSFWYAGFLQWIESLAIPAKTGKAYFLLGDQEAKAKVKAFQSVQADTEAIVALLKGNHIDASFELVPGNHYQYALERLSLAFTRIFGRG